MLSLVASLNLNIDNTINFEGAYFLFITWACSPTNLSMQTSRVENADVYSACLTPNLLQIMLSPNLIFSKCLAPNNTTTTRTTRSDSFLAMMLLIGLFAIITASVIVYYAVEMIEAVVIASDNVFFKNSLLAALVARKYATPSSREITLYCYCCIKNGLIIILNNNNGWNYNKSNWEYNTVKRLRRLCWFDAKIESIGLNSNIVLLLLFVKGFHFYQKFITRVVSHSYVVAKNRNPKRTVLDLYYGSIRVSLRSHCYVRWGRRLAHKFLTV